ncbi:fucolectin-like [Penaeus japonicus]|uniref:fucolectin-like n=1 Tax=Penaeus japonicus TaxID=27405 RepID=UPI001C712DA3|nr:fucolectin-like [Penaeus japonicus]
MVTRPLPCIPWEAEVSYPVRSNIICAFLSLRETGFAFLFQDGLCQVWGRGVEMPSSSRVFAKTSALPCTHLEEVALNKPTESSSEYAAFRRKEGGNDGLESTMFESGGDVRPWWLVDLETLNLVHTVEIMSRQNCCYERFHDVEFRVGLVRGTTDDFSAWPLLAFYKGPYTSADERINFTSPSMILGRYVVIQKISSDNQALQLVDVKVYGAYA